MSVNPEARIRAVVGEIVGDVLGDRAAPAGGEPLRSLGVSSIVTARLALEIERRLGVALPLEWLGSGPGLDELAARIAERSTDGGSGEPEAGRVEAAPGERFEPFPLTPMQEAYLIGGREELSDDPVGCHLYRELEVEGLDVHRLRAAWQRLVEHHDALRAVVTAGGRQRILERAPEWRLPVHDVAGGEGAFRERVAAVRRRLCSRRGDPGDGPPFAVEVSRREGGASVVHLSLDALVTDGHGLELLLRQWGRCYRRPDHPLPAPGLSVRDCVVSLAAARSQPGWRAALERWVERLDGMPPGPRLPRAAAPAGEGASGGGGFRRRPWNGSVAPEPWRRLRARAAELGVSPTSLVLTLFAETLARHGARQPFSLVVTTNRRVALPAEAERVVGPFTSSLVHVVGETLEQPFEEAVKTIHRRLWQELEDAAVSGVEALRELRRRGRGAEGIELPVVFTSTLDVGPGSPEANGDGDDAGFAPRLTYGVSRTSGVFLDHQMWEEAGELRYRWDVAEGVFEAGTVETLFAAFANALLACAADGEPAAVRPLNELQQAYFVARAGGGGDAEGCQVYHAFHLTELDLPRLEAAWQRLVAGHEPLRTVVTRDGRARVRARGADRLSIPAIDLGGVAGDGEVVAALRDRMVHRPFPLDRWPPFELRVTLHGDRGATVHVALDLLIADGRSLHLLLRESFRLYADPGAAPRPGRDFDRYLERRERLLTGPDHPRWQARWRQRIAALPPGPALTPAAPGADRRRCRFSGRVAGWWRVEGWAAERGVDPDALLLAALAEVLAAWIGPEDFAVPVVRWTAEEEPYRPAEVTALGWVVRSRAGDPGEGASLAARAADFRRQLADDPPGPVSGLGELRKRVMKERRGFALPVVYTSLLAFPDHPLPPGVRPGPWRTATPDVSLDCIGVAEEGELHYFWDVVEADFPGGRAAPAFAGFERLLELLAADPGSWERSDLAGPILGTVASDAERRRILHRWNDTAVDFPAERPLHHLFAERARERPAATALRHRGGATSYGELARRAGAVARRLGEVGVAPETVVGVRLRRSPEMVAAVFGVLGAGGAYLPLEPSLPAGRTALILEEAAASVLITAAGDLPEGVPPGCRVLELPAGAASDPEPAAPPLDEAAAGPAAGPGNTAYVIFTSGSTGKPKGVKVAHRSVLNLLHWCRRRFDFDADDLGLAVASLGFDLSVFDLFGLLGQGAALYLADEEEAKDPALLLGLLVAERVTFWNSAPAVLHQLAPLLPAHRGGGTGALRRVFLSGDYTPLSLPGEVRAVFPRARIVSLGGATEATVWSNFFPVAEIDPRWRSIPYGKPIDNARYYVVDHRLEPRGIEVEGDLVIGGDCLCVGYHRRPALTAERFVPDPFAVEPGGRLYRTGDRAAWFPNGDLRFLGRTDHQVKVRGFRVELGEIEHRLRRHPGVAEVVVAARDDDAGDRKLVAYVIPAGDRAPTVKELRRHAAEALPDYMVPNFVCTLDAFPATANGKLDRAALPWPLTGSPAAGSPAAGAPSPPSSPPTPPAPAPREAAPAPSVAELRDAVGSLFAELLGCEIDPAEDIWDQGATSFTVVQLSNALDRRYGLRLPVSTLLDDPTVDGIARHLGAADVGADGSGAGGDVGAAPPEPKSAPPEPEPAAVAPEVAGAEAPESVDYFSPEARARFHAEGRNLRPLGAGERRVRLEPVSYPAEYYRWRSSRREFLDGPIPLPAFRRFLALLAESPEAGRSRFLYPSAGDTYAVQCYLHLRPGAVAGLDPGLYYYHPREHALHLLTDRPELDRNHHFVFNRPIYDRAAFEIFLVGQLRGIEPLYRRDAERFLTLEAGYVGQLLMMGQAACGVGLCPVGSVAFDRIAPQLRLDEGHRFLQAFLGGRAESPRVAATGERPAFSAGADVAVVGVAGRYPGAADPETLWRRLAAGESAVAPLPAGRREGWSGEPPVGGFLERIDRFDARLFGVSPAEARTLDPQIRLLLETVWECLENAGTTAAGLRRTAPRVGVFAAVMWHDYHQVGRDRWAAGAEAPVSAMASDVANRVSHHFDFRGPSLAVDASCASSLAALHLAVASLRRGECDAAVVAGVNLVAHPYHLGLLREHGAVAAGAGGGAFDPEGSGWLPGEGCGAVLLRPAADAAAAGDFVHGVIEGTAVGHAGGGGRIGGRRFGAPDAGGLARSIAVALADAGVEPSAVDYVECAAAGAAVADAAEIEALAEVFGAGASREAEGGAVPVGTVKPNLGHLEAASGISQLTKVLLQMRHRELAPTRTSGRRHPLLPWDRLPLRVVERRQRWRTPGGRPARALINALGASGARGHAVVRAPDPAPAPEVSSPSPEARGPRWILLSAASRGRLELVARRLRDHLAALEERGEAPSVDGVAHTLQTGRVALAWRLAFPCDDLAGLRAGLAAFLDGRSFPGLRVGEVRGTAGEVPGADAGEVPGTAEAVASWLAGADVPWHRFWGTPPRRVPLPTYPFAEERHWLDPVVPATAAAPGPAEERRADDRRRRIGRRLREIYAEVSGIPVAEIDLHAPLEGYGLSSYLIGRLNRRLEEELGERSRTLFFEHPDLAGVAGQLSARPDAGDRRGAAVRTAAPAEDPEEGAAERIAVVGVAGRYPQAPDLERFWELLAAGRDAVTRLPAERRRPGWPVELMWGGFLDGVDRFDPLFFHVTPRDAERMDPQERLFLEVAWETLEDAGTSRRELRRRYRSRVGVFAGAMYNEYPFFGVERTRRGAAGDAGATLGGIANRVSYFLDLRGPSLTVDTMCSSSLTALHLAVESLRRGECDAALAGGVNLSLHPNKFVQIHRLGMAASDHRCRSFGAGGDGFVPGEGVGAVLLKPLSRAVADGDRIHAVILGTAVNHGGRSHGYTVPNPAAQGELIADALHRAGVDPATVGYLEAHGTGTGLGDPVEVNGLLRAFGDAGLEPGSRRIGSVKSNLGHLEAAAGIAGLTKVLLQMRHRRLVPSLHAERLNPDVDWQRSPFRVVRRGEEWRPVGDHPLRAGVSSFGAGGTNAHLVVEAWPAPEPASTAPARPQLVVLSAVDDDRLRAVAGRLAAFLAAGESPRLDDLAFTLQVGREPLRERLAVVVSEVAELRRRLERFAAGESSEPLRGRAPAGSPPAPTLPEGPPPHDLAELGRRWVAGAEVDWRRLHERRPRRIALPSYPFRRVRCWLPEDDGAPEPRAVPLFHKEWRDAGDGVAPAGSVTGRIVCLHRRSSAAVAEEVASRLGADAVAVGPGEVERVGEVAGWIDLCDLGSDGETAAEREERWSLLRRWLGRRVGTRDAATRRLLHVTAGLQGPPGAPPTLAGAAPAGLVRALAAEHRGVEVRTVDLDATPDRAADAAGGVVAEWRLAESAVEICRRGGRRLRPALVAAPAEPPAAAPDLGRTIVITGGTRGLGALVARHLVRRGARRLAILGRRELPPRERWSEPGAPPEVAAATSHLRGLEAAGARVLLHTGPLTRRRELAAFFDRVRSTLGEIGGVVHGAGHFSRGAFADGGEEASRAVLEPKVAGLELLAELLDPDPISFFLLFSSVAAAVPALGAGAAEYAAANAFMDFFAGHRHRAGRRHFLSVGWPPWRRSGGDGEAACARAGLAPLDDEEGLAVLDRALALAASGTAPAGHLLPLPARGELDPGALLEPPPLAQRAEPSATPAPSPASLPSTTPERWLVELFSTTLGIPEEQLDPTALFGELGVESVLLAELLQKIETRLGRRLEPSLLLDHPTLGELSARLGEEPGPDEGEAPEGVPAESSGSSGSSRVAESSPIGGDVDRRVAVIGLACRFPGAPDAAAFWELLAAGRCAVTEVSPSRWDPGRWYRPAREPGKSVSKWGGFVDGIEDFDPDFFGLDGEEATRLDPAIRLLLEAAVTCLRDAGYRDDEVAGREVGVFAGARLSDYRQRVRRRGAGTAGIAGDQSFIAARVAHQLDFRGPNLVVDSACASSLVAVHLACQSLWNGDCELALAGGVEVLLDQRPYLELTAAGALSPSGRCRAFDREADGFVPGEGCGVVLLKPLRRALRDGDRIRAVIRGSAVNNDGHTMGVTTPNPGAQGAVVRRALERSGLSAGEVGMVEAHGTGTVIGDPIELRALTDVFRRDTDRSGFCAIGSVKSNLGHLLSAAGVAGLIKAVLALEHRRIPPTLFCDTPNPRFDFAASPFFPNRRLREWPSAMRRRAGVSAFGLGGTNAHVVLAELDPALRDGVPEPRPPLPPPVFRRRRLWLEEDAAEDRDEEPVASILDFEFTGGPGATRSSP